MSNEYNARSALISDLTNKATDHLKAFKDGTLALEAMQMQLLPKPHYFQIYDVLTYKPKKTEYREKELIIKIDNRTGIVSKFKIFIANKGKCIENYTEIDEKEYLGKGQFGEPVIQWIKIYEMLDIRAYSAEFIKKYIVGMKKSGLKKDEVGVKANLQGIWLHGAKLEEANLEEANLQGVSLQGADLSGANLYKANLQESYLQGAILQEANLQKTNLERANLQEANLIVMQLQEADLSMANLRKTNLIFSNLQGADLNKTDFREAKFRQTNFKKAIIGLINEKITLEEVLLNPDLFEKHKKDLPRFSSLVQLEGAIFHEDCGIIDGKIKNALIEAEKWKLEHEKKNGLSPDFCDYRLTYLDTK
ncbi:hypothetical protein LBMAG18_01740 [Alphaproteobacteria bacterium]|nr:hypothetical protein LBMAG18_01740 [Alphaproteobacteria bacterium]